MKAVIKVTMLVFGITTICYGADPLTKGVQELENGNADKAIEQLNLAIKKAYSIQQLAEAEFYLGAAKLSQMAVGSRSAANEVYQHWRNCDNIDLLEKWKPQMRAMVEERLAQHETAQELNGLKIQLALLADFTAADLNMEVNDIDILFARAEANHMASNFASAMDDYQKVIALYEKKPTAAKKQEALTTYYRLADDLYYRQAIKAEALTIAQKGLALDSGYQQLEVLAAMLMNSMPEHQAEAIEKLDKLIVKFPENETLMLYQARNLERKDPEKAAQYYERLLDTYPADEDMLYFLGQYYINLSDDMNREGKGPQQVMNTMNKGLAYFEQLHQLNPLDVPTMEILIRFYGYQYREKEVALIQAKLNEVLADQ